MCIVCVCSSVDLLSEINEDDDDDDDDMPICFQLDIILA